MHFTDRETRHTVLWLGVIVIACRHDATEPTANDHDVIMTVAGSGPAYVGDGGPAVDARLSGPSDLATDAAGNIYIADQLNHRVRRIDRGGVISTVAGSDSAGASGDGSQATAATLTSPSAIAVDASGALYVADPGAHRVRKIAASGTITTVAGTGTAGFSGDGGAASAAQLNAAWGIEVDAAGNVYVADTDNHRIRRISPSGTITTIAGTGTAGFSGDGSVATSAQLNSPRGLALDGAGNLYVADEQNNRIRRINLAAGTITSFAGTGTQGFSGDGAQATAANLFRPKAVSVDAQGNIYIADTRNLRVRRVDASGVIATVALSGRRGFAGDGGPALNALGTAPHGLAFDAAGNLLITDYGNNAVRRVDARGIIMRVAGTGLSAFGNGGPAVDAHLGHPRAVALDRAGNLYISDWFNNVIRKVDRAGTITTYAGTGTYAYSGDGGPATQAELNVPHGIVADAAGNLYITDGFNNRVRKVDAQGIITTVVGNGQPGVGGNGELATAAAVGNPSSVAVDGAGNLYISQQSNNVVRRVTPDGRISTIAGTGVAGFSGDGGPATLAQLRTPIGISSDAAGNLFIAEQGNNRIRKVSANGIISTVAGDGVRGYGGDGGPATAARLDSPFGVVVAANGVVYFTDSRSERIRRIALDGTISTVAGNGLPGYSGDGGPATRAQLRGPHDVRVDEAGDLYIADTANDRVRKVMLRR